MKLHKVTPRVYYLDFVQESDRPVLGLIVGDECSLVVDGGNSQGHANVFLKEIEQLNIPPVKYLALTHWHWDHIFGVNTIGATTLVEKRTAEKLEEIKDWKWTDEAIEERVETGEEIAFCRDHIKIEMPNSNRHIEIPKADIVYEDSLEIDLGGVKVELQHIGGDHAHDSVVVSVKEESVLFLGDCLYVDMYHGEWSYSPDKLYPLLETLKAYEADHYIPCHHGAYTKDTFHDFVKHIHSIGEIVGEETSAEKVIQQFPQVMEREPGEYEVEDLTYFVQGNRKYELPR